MPKAVHVLALLANKANELVFYLAVHKHVVWCHARLAHVEPLAKGDASRRHAQVGASLHDAGALATQLERHGREVLGRPCHDELAHGNATGEEDVVPALVEKRLVLRAPALDDAHEFGLKRLLAYLAQHRGGCRRVGTRLHDHGVARRQGARERLEREQKRVVPRRHDERDAVGHALHAARGHGVGEVCRARAGPCPARDVPQLVANLGEGQARLAHVALVG